MTLKGWSLPLSPAGTAALVPPPPWHFSGEARGIADPARGQYREAYLSVNAILDGRKVARVPYIWVDNDLSFARGHIQGFPKKMGSVAITRAVRVGQGGPKVETGGR